MLVWKFYEDALNEGCVNPTLAPGDVLDPLRRDSADRWCGDLVTLMSNHEFSGIRYASSEAYKFQPLYGWVSNVGSIRTVRARACESHRMLMHASIFKVPCNIESCCRKRSANRTVG